jgi:hypothetical protein
VYRPEIRTEDHLCLGRSGIRRALLLTTAFFFFIVAATAQLSGKRTEVKNANDRYFTSDSSLQLPEGTTVKGGKVTIEKGYRIVFLDSNRIIIVQKPNGETTGAFRCGCTTAGRAGDRVVAFTGNEIHCVSGCSMDVALNLEKNISITQRNVNWRKFTLSSAGTQAGKIGTPARN